MHTVDRAKHQIALPKYNCSAPAFLERGRLETFFFTFLKPIPLTHPLSQSAFAFSDVVRLSSCMSENVSLAAQVQIPLQLLLLETYS